MMKTRTFSKTWAWQQPSRFRCLAQGNRLDDFPILTVAISRCQSLDNIAKEKQIEAGISFRRQVNKTDEAEK